MPSWATVSRIALPPSYSTCFFSWHLTFICFLKKIHFILPLECDLQESKGAYFFNCFISGIKCGTQEVLSRCMLNEWMNEWISPILGEAGLVRRFGKTALRNDWGEIWRKSSSKLGRKREAGGKERSSIECERALSHLLMYLQPL